MKKIYEQPIMEVVDIEDIITDELEQPDGSAGNSDGVL